jgi:hypothetical protein
VGLYHIITVPNLTACKDMPNADSIKHFLGHVLSYLILAEVICPKLNFSSQKTGQNLTSET